MIKAFEESELETTGSYPAVGKAYGYDQYDTEKLNPPITPRENYELFFERKPVCWVPDLNTDCAMICPDLIPDNVACGFGGGYDNFGVKWIPDTSSPDLPAFVEPGFTKLRDIDDWESLEFPDIDSWDWEGGSQDYQVLDPDRLNVGIMQTGQYERLVSVMGFVDAAASMLENPDATHALLDKFADTEIEMLKHYKQYFNCDMIMFHDDWGAQRAPFFSLDMAREFFVPTLSKVTTACHELGMKFMHHSCGHIESLLPVMIEGGCDLWQFNWDAVRDGIAQTIADNGDKILFDGYFAYITPLSDDDETAKAEAKAYYDAYASHGNLAVSVYDYAERSYDTRKMLYELSRKRAIENSL